MKAKTPWCDRIKRRYYKRAERYLKRVAVAARAHGFGCGDPFDMSDDEYTLALNFSRDGENVADVMLHFTEERVREGDGEGVALDVRLTATGGRCLGGYCPCNYSEELWVPPGDYAEMGRRFAGLESISPEEWVECVKRFLERESTRR